MPSGTSCRVSRSIIVCVRSPATLLRGRSFKWGVGRPPPKGQRSRAECRGLRFLPAIALFFPLRLASPASLLRSRALPRSGLAVARSGLPYWVALPPARPRPAGRARRGGRPSLGRRGASSLARPAVRLRARWPFGGGRAALPRFAWARTPSPAFSKRSLRSMGPHRNFWPWPSFPRRTLPLRRSFRIT